MSKGSPRPSVVILPLTVMLDVVLFKTMVPAVISPATSMLLVAVMWSSHFAWGQVIEPCSTQSFSQRQLPATVRRNCNKTSTGAQLTVLLICRVPGIRIVVGDALKVCVAVTTQTVL